VLDLGRINPGRQVALATFFFIAAPNICGSSIWNLLRNTLLLPRVLRWPPDFWKICGSPRKYICKNPELINKVFVNGCRVFTFDVLTRGPSVGFRFETDEGRSLSDSAFLFILECQKIELHFGIRTTNVQCYIYDVLTCK
jgi:hypothetical protein